MNWGFAVGEAWQAARSWRGWRGVAAMIAGPRSFEAQTGVVAIAQASGSDYPGVLARALDYPVVDDQDGDALRVDSGELAIFNAALDGADQYSVPWASARPGPVPPVHGPPPREGMHPGLLVSTLHTDHKLKVRWHSKLDDGSCFARWLLIPIPANC
jgi:hypothetical protein